MHKRISLVMISFILTGLPLSNCGATSHIKQSANHSRNDENDDTSLDKTGTIHVEKDKNPGNGIYIKNGTNNGGNQKGIADSTKLNTEGSGEQGLPDDKRLLLTQEEKFLTVPPHKDVLYEREVFDEKIRDLVMQIAQGVPKDKKVKLSVGDFSDFSGERTLFTKFLTEELITLFSVNPGFEVVDNLHQPASIYAKPSDSLEDAQIDEGATGIDVVVTGTIMNLGDTVKINTRLVSRENGVVIAATSTSVPRDKAIEGLMEREYEDPASPLPVQIPVQSDLYARIDELVRQMVKTLPEDKKYKVRLLMFTDPKGETTSLSEFLAGEIVNRLFTYTTFEIVDEGIANQVSSENDSFIADVTPNTGFTGETTFLNKFDEGIANQASSKNDLFIADVTSGTGSTDETTPLTKFLVGEIVDRLFTYTTFETVDEGIANQISFKSDSFIADATPNEALKNPDDIFPVDTVIKGVTTDLGPIIRLNIHMLNANTGFMVGAAAIDLRKDETIVSLIEEKITGKVPQTIAKAIQEEKRMVRKNEDNEDKTPGAYFPQDYVFFKKDFLDYEDGELALGWGDGLIVQKDENRYVLTSLKDEFLIGRQVLSFPEEFSFGFEVKGDSEYWSAVRLQDNEENEFEIAFKLFQDVLYITLPGPKMVKTKVSTNDFNEIRLVKKNKLYELYANDSLLLVSTYTKFSNFGSFEIHSAFNRFRFANFIGRRLES